MNIRHRYMGLRPMTGVGMVEVLVAFVVLSVGLLGTATLYVNALQAKTSSQSRMQAINLATDIADRIRANRTAISSYVVAQGTVLSAPTANCIDTSSTTSVACTGLELATVDLYKWTQAVTSTLPGSTNRSITCVAATATVPQICTINIGWTEPKSGNAALSYSLQVQI